MTPLPSPQQLRYLLALAESGHFGRAAETCAVTQSTLSAGILALERQLDAAILDRIDEIVPPGTDVGSLDQAYLPPALLDPGLRRRPAGNR